MCSSTWIGTVEYIIVRLESARLTHVCELARVDFGHLQNDDPSAYNGERENDRDDLGGTSLQTLVQDDRRDQGTEGN